jgi:hypothetical protein
MGYRCREPGPAPTVAAAPPPDDPPRPPPPALIAGAERVIGAPAPTVALPELRAPI